MTIKYVMTDVIKCVEERVARRWLGGAGQAARFADDSEGWYAVFESCPASMFLGAEKPRLAAGDRVRLTLERA